MVTKKDIGKRFRVQDRYGSVILVAISKDGKTAFVDTTTDAERGRKKTRYEEVSVGALYRTAAEAKGVQS